VEQKQQGTTSLARGSGRVISEELLPEFDREMADTRRTLERWPDDKLGWKPHERSSAMGWLATFLAVLPSWAVSTIQKESFDIAPASGGTTAPRSVAATRGEFRELFEFRLDRCRFGGFLND
jgi:hypothetical protein